MHEWDAYTIEHEPISSLDLMERAATAVAQVIMSRWPTDKPVVAFVGPGNNGGDALVVARVLAANGYKVNTYLFNTGEHLSADCRKNKQRAADMPGVNLTEVTTRFDPPVLTDEHLVIDGLFGTGLSRPLTGGFAVLVNFINASPATVLSIDLPSGLYGEGCPSENAGPIVRADITLTFQRPKLCCYLADSQLYLGKVEVLNIGLLPSGAEAVNTPYLLTEKADVRKLLRVRPPFAHKGTFGHALLIAGSFGMAGSALLAARSCLRGGVGKLTVHTPFQNVCPLQIGIPEAVLHLDDDDKIFTRPVPTAQFSAVALGPGLGAENATMSAVVEQISHTPKPLVIDADGLNILASHSGWIERVPAGTILTPHPLELSRLCGCSMNSADLLDHAQKLAARQNVYVVLKGHNTAVCVPNGRVFINPTGNSGMATAGCGDVLTGLLLSLLGQGYEPQEACVLGVYLHGLAGDLALAAKSSEGLIASDLIDFLPQAFHVLREG